MHIVCIKCLEKIDIENKSNYVFNNKEYYHNNCFIELKKKSNFVKGKFLENSIIH